MVKRILVALSGTPFTGPAIQYAIDLARLHKAEVTGVTDVDVARLAHVGPVPIGGGAVAHDLAEHRIALTQEHIDDAIRSFETACRDAGMVHCVARESGNPFETLTSLWRYHDLTIAGLRGLFEYGVVHNPNDVLIQLISTGIRPILAVAKEHRPIRRVLIAYNGSTESAKALKRFVQLSLWPDVTLKIACFDTDADEAKHLLADAATYCRAHGHEAETESVEGAPPEALLEHADQWQADLMVMGSAPRARLFKRLLGGSTTSYAIQHAEIPLFLTQ